MNTFMSRKQAVVQQPPLRRMLSDQDIRTYHRYALKRWRSEPTERIVRSLQNGRLEPLWVTEDGLVENRVICDYFLGHGYELAFNRLSRQFFRWLVVLIEAHLVSSLALTSA